MKNPAECWQVKDKSRLLLAMMNALAGNAHVSFEGDLSGLRLSAIPGSSERETDALKRQTRWPEQNFITVPLEAETAKAVLFAIGGNVPRKIFHIQIEKKGVVEFAAYDNFHAGCIVFGQAVKPELISSLVTQGVLIECAKQTE